MAKVFISVPMHNRKWNDVALSISKMTEIAKRIYGEDCIIVSDARRPKPDDALYTSLWALGEALKLLSKADSFIGFTETEMKELGFNGCAIETKCALNYHLDMHYCDIAEICPDINSNESRIIKCRDCKHDDGDYNGYSCIDCVHNPRHGSHFQKKN